MSVATILDELKSTLAEQMEIFVRASTEVKESSAIINKTQAAIAALEGNPLSGYEGSSNFYRPGAIEEVATFPMTAQAAEKKRDEILHMFPPPTVEPGFFYDSDGVLRPVGWDASLNTAEPIPTYKLPPLPTEDFADAGDLLGLRG